jgi:hypothetical protein
MIPSVGIDKGVTWNGTPIGIFGYDDNDECDLSDWTSSIHVGQQALVAAIRRPSGSWTMVFDISNAPVAAGITAGTFGTVVMATGAAPISRSVRISKVNIKDVVSDVIRVSVDWKASVS